MKRPIDIKLVKFYLWLGLAYWVMGVLSTYHIHPGKFDSVLINNVWGVIYLIPVNFIFLEYTIPFVLRKRKYLIYNILLGVLLLWVHMIFWSYVSYCWRSLGIQLHIFTSLKDFQSLDKLLQNQMGYSAGSIVL